jgi:hypothetical protein
MSEFEEMIINDFEIDTFNDEEMDTDDKYIYLLDKYTKLLKNYKSLCNEYSENTIIESMNEMKERYEQLQKDTVSIYRYNELDKKYKKQNKVITAIYVIIENTINRLRDMDFNMMYDKQKDIYRCEIELMIILELLEQFAK